MPLTWRGDEAMRRIRVGAARGLSRAAKALLAESQTRVPVRDRDLRNSGASHDATPQNLTSAVTYSATSEDGFPYAVVQHERLDFNHPTDFQPGAQAKYLERPAMEMKNKLMGVVATEINREVG